MLFKWNQPRGKNCDNGRDPCREDPKPGSLIMLHMHKNILYCQWTGILFEHFFLHSVVPFGKNNVYTMPCDITFWGRPENEQDVIQRMRRHGYILRTFREPIPQKSGAPGPNNSRPVMGLGRPPSIKISYDKVYGSWTRFLHVVQDD